MPLVRKRMVLLAYALPPSEAVGARVPYTVIDSAAFELLVQLEDVTRDARACGICRGPFDHIELSADEPVDCFTQQLAHGWPVGLDTVGVDCPHLVSRGVGHDVERGHPGDGNVHGPRTRIPPVYARVKRVSRGSFRERSFYQNRGHGPRP